MFGRQSSPDLKSRMWKFAYRGRSHAETCPVCHGKGKIQKKDEGYTPSRPKEVACHGCFGRGWITVGD